MSEDDSAIGPILRAVLGRVATLERLLSEVYGAYANLGMSVVGLEVQLR